MEETQTQIDEILARIDESDQSLSDYSDTLDNNLNDLQTAIDDSNQTISDLQESAGQLQFPLTQDTIDLIKEQFPVGQITLSGGVATLYDGRITNNSTIIHSVRYVNGTPGTYYTVSVGNGYANFSASIGSDNSTLNYLIL